MSTSVPDNIRLICCFHCEITRICKLVRGLGWLELLNPASRIAPTLTELSSRESLYLTLFKLLILFGYYVDSDSR
jgi:hypothetical protein